MFEDLDRLRFRRRMNRTHGGSNSRQILEVETNPVAGMACFDMLEALSNSIVVPRKIGGSPQNERNLRCVGEGEIMAMDKATTCCLDLLWSRAAVAQSCTVS